MMDRHDKQKILAELGGLPEDVYDDLMGDFKQQTSGQIETMKACLLENKFGDIQELSHSIKGSSGNLRIHDVYQVAKDLEGAARESRVEDIRSLLTCLEDVFRRQCQS